MNLTIHQVSRLVSKLKERGFVNWSHDNDGTEGTYITVTNTGVKCLEKQDQKLYAYYEEVINRYGKESMLNLLKEMKRFEQIVESVCVKES